jgi:hypothetical protein
MRKTIVVATVSMATLLVAGVAGAAGGKNGPTGGAGGSVSFGGGKSATGGGGAGLSDSAEEGQNADAPRETKKWQIYGVFETHRLVRQSDLGGDAPNKTFNFMYLYPSYDITPKDRVSIRAGFYQRFLADQGETGLRLDDTVFAYTRFVPLPEEIMLRLGGWVTAPTSFDSKLAGIITVPRLSLRLDKFFGRVGVKAITYGEYYVAKYRTAAGGSPNPQTHYAALLEAEYRIPYIEKLFMGASIATGYTWYYGVDSPNAGPTVGDTQFTRQPVQQSYGGEIFARYEFPKWEGLMTDLTLAYAQGDPTLGYTSALHDGARHLYYGFNRHVSEVYAALSARY